jgi:hypothetical protein
LFPNKDMVELFLLADHGLLSSGSGLYVVFIPNSKLGGLELRARCGEKVSVALA